MTHLNNKSGNTPGYVLSTLMLVQRLILIFLSTGSTVFILWTRMNLTVAIRYLSHHFCFTGRKFIAAIKCFQVGFYLQICLIREHLFVIFTRFYFYSVILFRCFYPGNPENSRKKSIFPDWACAVWVCLTYACGSNISKHKNSNLWRDCSPNCSPVSLGEQLIKLIYLIK